MNRDILDTGFWFGLALMAVVTFILNWFIYSELKTQRDHWMRMYCLETELQISFCKG